MDISVRVDPPNGRSPRRVVHFTGADREHTDTLDPFDGFGRQKCLDRVAQKFGVPRHHVAAMDDAILSAAESADAEDAAGDTNQEFRIDWVTCRDLDASNYNVKFLIDNTLVENQPCLIGAAAKSCKTLLALDAAVSLATGTPFLGQMEVSEPMNVGYICGEGGLSILQEYTRRVARARGGELRDIDKLFLFDTLPQLADLTHLDALEVSIRSRELRVIVLDPLYLCMPGDDANNLMKQGKVLRRVNQVCLSNGCTPILIHHCRKNTANPYLPPELADLSWSGFQEFAGQWWLAGRREKYNPDQSGEHKLWLSIGGRAGHSALHALDIHEGRRADPGGRRWEVDVMSPRDAREDAQNTAQAAKDEERQQALEERTEADKGKILAVLAKHPAGETRTAIRDMSGLHSTRFGLAFGELLADGDVSPTEVIKGNRKAPFDGYKIAEG